MFLSMIVSGLTFTFINAANFIDTGVFLNAVGEKNLTFYIAMIEYRYVFQNLINGIFCGTE